MKSVAIVAMNDAMASSVSDPADIFYQAGMLWNYFNGRKLTPFFKVRIVSSSGRPLTCLSGVRILPQASLADVLDCDLIVVSSILDIERTLSAQRDVVDWLVDRYRQGAHIASVCTGAFVLAETGLLDGRTATTHWGYADQFRSRYPQIKLEPERLITDEGDLFCSGGCHAGIDLSLYLVEKYCGRDVALQSAKSVLADTGRVSQAPYAAFKFKKNHRDGLVLAVQEWIEANFDRNFTYDSLADDFGISRRTLERRFKASTGHTPLTYQQRIRIEAAKRQLEEGSASFKEITRQAGYEDSSSFRKMFTEQTGLRPSEYRRKFNSGK